MSPLTVVSNDNSNSSSSNDSSSVWQRFHLLELVYAMAPAAQVIQVALSTSDHPEEELARAIQRAWQDEYAPSKSYLSHLVKLLVKTLGEDQIASELVMELLLEMVVAPSAPSVSSLSSKPPTRNPVDHPFRSGVPNPMKPCFLSFWRPSSAVESSLSLNSEPLRMRIFPKHQDVALRLWEGGAALAEFLLLSSTSNSSSDLCLRNKTVVELGGGTGLTSLVAATLGAKTVHCTDYTDACLENMGYNIQLNQAWLQQHRKQEDSSTIKSLVTVGYLDWTWFEKQVQNGASSEQLSEPEQGLEQLDRISKQELMKQQRNHLAQSDILVAADVIYDHSVLSSLVHTIRYFLTTCSSNNNDDDTTSPSPPSPPKVALLATTRRNLETFELLQEELVQQGIQSTFARDKEGKVASIGADNVVFPCHFIQPRSDVWFTKLTLAE